MKSICQFCGKIGELVSCNICGARICNKCQAMPGCKLCRGQKEI